MTTATPEEAAAAWIELQTLYHDKVLLPLIFSSHKKNTSNLEDSGEYLRTYQDGGYPHQLYDIFDNSQDEKDGPRRLAGSTDTRFMKEGIFLQ